MLAALADGVATGARVGGIELPGVPSGMLDARAIGLGLGVAAAVGLGEGGGSTVGEAGAPALCEAEPHDAQTKTAAQAATVSLKTLPFRACRRPRTTPASSRSPVRRYDA